MLIVLDLNGTIAQKTWNEDFTKVKWESPKNIGLLWSIIREKKVDVIIWSSATRKTINSWLYQCVPDDVRNMFIDILCQRWCKLDEEHPKIINGKNIAYLKNLSIFWKGLEEYNENNTFIFDNSFEKVRQNPEKTIKIVNGDLESNVTEICNFVHSFLEK